MLTKATPATCPLPPLPDAIIVTHGDAAIVPHPDGGHAIAPIGQGIALAWAPVPELGGVALVQFIAKGVSAGTVAVFSREGLRGHIAELQSIAAQLGDD